MAKDEEEIDLDKEEGEKKSTPSTAKIIIIVVALILVLGGGMAAATLYFISNMNSEEVSSKKDAADGSSEEEDEEAESKPAAPPQYYSMDPKFVASFANQQNARFMQFSLEIMARDSEVIKQVETHMSVIRSSLLMLFGSQAYQDMVTREGKEKLLADVAADINTTLQKITGKEEPEATVEAAYFNSFVIQ